MTKKVYFNHDGNTDDLVSLFLLLQMENIELTGVSVIDADGYVEPAATASCKIIDRFGHGKKVSVAKSDSRGKNPFPKEWRMQSFFINALPILNESDGMQTEIPSVPAHQHLIETLHKTKGNTTLLFTGPLTDLARALEIDPTIEDKIEKLYWMGGTLLERGNVEDPGHDGTAEWNAYWDPNAVARVFDSDIEIEMVALESTNQVPLTPQVQKQWARERRFCGLDFIGQCYAMCSPMLYIKTNTTYYLWDVLTTASVGKPDLVKRLKKRVIAHQSGPSQGKIEENTHGRSIHVVYDVDRKAFFSYIVYLSKKADNLIPHPV